jgi:hypothetical protein
MLIDETFETEVPSPLDNLSAISTLYITGAATMSFYMNRIVIAASSACGG